MFKLTALYTAQYYIDGIYNVYVMATVLYRWYT